MTPSTLSLVCLRLRLRCARFGWINSIALALLVLAVVAGGWQLDYLQNEADAASRALQRAQLSVQSDQRPAGEPVLPVSEQRLNLFRETLGEKHHAEQQVKTLFGIAGKSGLSLNQGEYKFTHDKNGNFYTYQIILPVKGPYAAIRAFCEQTLLAVPFASMDDISFKRDAIGSHTPEAKIRFTLYLQDRKTPAAELPQHPPASRGTAL